LRTTWTLNLLAVRAGKAWGHPDGSAAERVGLMMGVGEAVGVAVEVGVPVAVLVREGVGVGVQVAVLPREGVAVRANVIDASVS